MKGKALSVHFLFPLLWKFDLKVFEKCICLLLKIFHIISSELKIICLLQLNK